MKTHSLFTILCIIATMTFAQNKPTFIFQLSIPSLDKYVFPNTNYGSAVNWTSGGNISYSVKVNWTIQNGTISANGKSSKSTLTTPIGTTITIVWDDTPSNGKISAEVD